MKNKYKYLSFVALALLASSCIKASMNTNVFGVSEHTYKATGLATASPFVGLSQDIIRIGAPGETTGPGNDLQNTDLISSGNYIGYFGNNNNWNFNIESNWNFIDSRMSYAFDNFFTKPVSNWISIYNQLKDAKDPVLKSIFSMAQVTKVLALLRATDVFGPIPYKDIARQSISPKFESQKDVYTDMLEDLVAARDQFLVSGAKAFSKYDYIYGGDLSKWTKLANSLILRLAVRVHFVDQDLANKYIALAVDPSKGGLITNVDEVACLKSSASLPLLSPYIASVVDYGETRMGATMWSYLKGYVDPRISSMYTKGSYYDNNNYYFIAPENINPKQGNKSHRSPFFASMPKLTSTAQVVFFRASETYFLLAEAALYKLGGVTGSAEDYYKQGVETSFEENGLKASDADTYLRLNNLPKDISEDDYMYSADSRNYSSPMKDGNVSPKWNDIPSGKDTKEAQLQKIITQKYIALYPNAVEAWTEYRRTGYPYIARPYDTKAGSRIGNPNLLAPERFKFASTEYLKNPNMKDIPQLLGGNDIGSTKLWWVRKDRPVQNLEN